MIRNLRKHGTATVIGLSMVATFGVANADCRHDDGLSRDGSVGPAELLVLCADQDKADALDSTAKKGAPREHLKQERVSSARAFEGVDTIR